MFAFCGLGNPVGFRRTLDDLDCEIVEFLEFPDHHDYTRNDLDSFRATIRTLRPDFVICTHKDLVKIDLDQIEGIPLRALVVEQQILCGQELLEAKLANILDRVTNDSLPAEE